MADKGISIKNRNYELYMSLKSKKDKTDEEYFRILYTIIPHKHPFIVTSKEIFEYVTKLLRIKKKLEKELKSIYLDEYCMSEEEFTEYLEGLENG